MKRLILTLLILAGLSYGNSLPPTPEYGLDKIEATSIKS